MRNNNPVADGLSGHFLTSCNPDDQPDLWGLIRSWAISHLQAIKLSGLIHYSPFPIKTSSFFYIFMTHQTSTIHEMWSWRRYSPYSWHIFAWGWKKVLDHIVNNYQFNWVLTFLWFTQEKHISLLGPGCGTQEVEVAERRRQRPSTSDATS